MEEHIVRILNIEPVTHNVKRFRVERPANYQFMPGQATEVAINTPQLREERRPFTFTSLSGDSFLEFTIKIYDDHQGVTHEMGKLKPGDELLLHDVWGAIAYKGKGVFIAGGAGVTPFIAIFRDLHSRNELTGNMLIFANRTSEDIIMENDFRAMLGKDFVNILSDEKMAGYHHGFISEAFLASHISGSGIRFYVCGPPPMMDAVLKIIEDLGYTKDSVTIEL